MTLAILAPILVFVLVGILIGGAVVGLATKVVILPVALVLGTAMVLVPKGAFFAILATLPVYFGFASGIKYHVVMVAFPLLVILIAFLIKRGPWPIPLRWPEGYIAMAFFGLTLASAVKLDEPMESLLVAAAMYGPMAIIFFTTLAFVEDERDVVHVLWCVLAIGIGECAASAVVEMWLGGSLSVALTAAEETFALAGTFGPGDHNFLAGTTWHPYVFGGFLAMVVLIALSQALWVRRPETKILFFALAGVALFFCYFTFARSAIIGLFLSLCVGTALLSKLGRYLMLSLAVCSVAIAAFYGFSLPLLVRDIEASTFIGGMREAGSFESSWIAFLYRLETWGIAWNVFQAHPFLGLGTGTSGDAWTPNYLPPWATTWAPLHGKGAHGTAGGTTHNAFLAVLAENGIFAFVAFLGLWAWALRSLLVASRHPRYQRYAQLIFVIMIGQFVVVSLNPMYRDIWLSFALAFILGRLAQAEPYLESSPQNPHRPGSMSPVRGNPAAAQVVIPRET